jgi:hypothetical protein
MIYYLFCFRFLRRKMSENPPCRSCEQILESYKRNLDYQKKELISFRGHGIRTQKTIKSPRPPLRTYKNDEVKLILKLIILGARKFHFHQNNIIAIDESFGGIRLKSLRKIFQVSITIKLLVIHQRLIDVVVQLPKPNYQVIIISDL